VRPAAPEPRRYNRVRSTDAPARWVDRADASVRVRRDLARRNLNPQMALEGLLLALGE
jgi:hypothetical protein